MSREPFGVGVAKVVTYLLNPSHPDGASKARFLLAFGFTADQPERVAEAFLNHTRREPTRILSNEFGRRFVFVGPLETPDGRNPSVRSVWQETQDNGFAHLVTAVPLGDS